MQSNPIPPPVQYAPQVRTQPARSQSRRPRRASRPAIVPIAWLVFGVVSMCLLLGSVAFDLRDPGDFHLSFLLTVGLVRGLVLCAAWSVVALPVVAAISFLSR